MALNLQPHLKVAWFPKTFVFAVLLGLKTSVVLAQATVEIPIIRDQAKEQLLPPFLHALSPQIQEQLQEKIVEMDEGFTRNQFIEIPISTLLKDRETEFLKMIRDDAQLKEQWSAFLEKLNFLTVRISFKLKILPNSESLTLQFKPPSDSRSLVSFDGSLKAKPDVQVLEISGFEIIELDDRTGRGTSYSLPSEMRKLDQIQTLAFDRSTEFKLSASLIENFTATDPKKVFQVNLEKWESTFKDVLLSEESAVELLNNFLKEERFFALANTIARTKTYQELLGSDQTPNTSLVEKEIKAQLDARKEKMILWIERDEKGKLKPHLSSDNEKNRSRIEKARKEKRLLVEAHAEIPLSIESIDVAIDYSKKMARAKFQPHPEFDATFSLKSFELPKEWMGEIDDPIIKNIVEQLYGRNLFEGKDVSVHVKLNTREHESGKWLEGLGGSLEVPLEFVEVSPEDPVLVPFFGKWVPVKQRPQKVAHIKSEATKVDLPFLDQVRFQEIDVGWGTEKQIKLRPQSAVSLDEQIVAQLDAFVEAHEIVLGPEFFKNIEGQLLLEGERQIEQLQWAVTGRTEDDPSYNLRVTQFPLTKEGGVSCKVIPTRKNRPNLGYRFLPPGLGFDIVSAPSVLEFECDFKIPSKIDLSLSNVKAPMGDVSKIDFSLLAKDGQPQVAKSRMRLVRDPEGGFLMLVPEALNIDEILKNYDIPKTGVGAPRMYGIDAHGVKGFASDIAKAPSIIWTYFVNPRVNLGPMTELVVTGTTLSTYIFASNKEHEVVDQMLRDSVKKSMHEMSFKLPETLFTELNGDVIKRRKLLKQPQFSEQTWELLRRPSLLNQDNHLIDPKDVKIGYVGLAEARILEKLKEVQEHLPYKNPVGPFVFDENGKNLRQEIEGDVRDEAIKTIEDKGGVKKVSEIISNKKLWNIASKIRQEGVTYITQAVSRTASALESAVIDFLRTLQKKPPRTMAIEEAEGNEPSERSVDSEDKSQDEVDAPAPLEAFERLLSDKLFEKATEKSKLNIPQLNLPDFCGVSLTPFRDEDVGDVLSLMVNLEGYQQLPTLGALRPEDSPKMKDLLKAYDQEGVIPVAVSTDVFERIANEPGNLDRVTKLIREEAVKQPGIREEDFNLEIRQPKVRMREDGQAVVRVGVKINQEATTLQSITSVIGFIPDAILSLFAGEDVRPFRTIAGLPGWLADQLTSPITDIDGFMELEIPVNIAIGDRMHADGKHIGHYLEIWTDPDQVKIRNKEGWSSVFGSLARDKIEENANSFGRGLNFDQPLAVPGFEDLMTFQMGNTLQSEIGRKTVVGIPTAREIYQGVDGLYTGSFIFKLRPKINPAYQSWPTITVTKPNSVAKSAKTD